MPDTQPTVIDFDDGEISVRLDGKELRGWSVRPRDVLGSICRKADRMSDDIADWQRRCLGGPTGWKILASLYAAMLISALT